MTTETKAIEARLDRMTRADLSMYIIAMYDNIELGRADAAGRMARYVAHGVAKFNLALQSVVSGPKIKSKIRGSHYASHLIP